MMDNYADFAKKCYGGFASVDSLYGMRAAMHSWLEGVCAVNSIITHSATSVAEKGTEFTKKQLLRSKEQRPHQHVAEALKYDLLGFYHDLGDLTKDIVEIQLKTLKMLSAVDCHAHQHHEDKSPKK